MITILSWREGYRLSLAGVAGLIVAIGFTADSFIVYFERIRDELRDGTRSRRRRRGGLEARAPHDLAAKSVNLLSAVILFIARRRQRAGLRAHARRHHHHRRAHRRSCSRTRCCSCSPPPGSSRAGIPLSGLDPTALGAVYRGRAEFRVSAGCPPRRRQPRGRAPPDHRRAQGRRTGRRNREAVDATKAVDRDGVQRPRSRPPRRRRAGPADGRSDSSSSATTSTPGTRSVDFVGKRRNLVRASPPAHGARAIAVPFIRGGGRLRATASTSASSSAADRSSSRRRRPEEQSRSTPGSPRTPCTRSCRTPWSRVSDGRRRRRPRADRPAHRRRRPARSPTTLQARRTTPTSVTSSFIGATWGADITQQALRGLGRVPRPRRSSSWRSTSAPGRCRSRRSSRSCTTSSSRSGVYALTGFEITPAAVIGFLTILGYSLYDTVVVFDKIRENTAELGDESNRTFGEAVNLAVNQTLVRSINTGVVAALPVAAILFIGAFVARCGHAARHLARPARRNHRRHVLDARSSRAALRALPRGRAGDRASATSACCSLRRQERRGLSRRPQRTVRAGRVTRSLVELRSGRRTRAMTRDADAERASRRALLPRLFSRAQPTGRGRSAAQDGAHAPPEGRHRAHRARLRRRREGALRPEAQERRAVHHPPGRGRADPRRPRHRPEDARRRAAARHRRGHRLHARHAARRLRRRDRHARRRRHQARQAQVRRQRSGRDRAQDGRRDVEGHPGADHQARRPPAQRAHLGLRARRSPRRARRRRPSRSTRRWRTASASRPSSGSSKTSRSRCSTRSSTSRSRAWCATARRSARSSCSVIDAVSEDLKAARSRARSSAGRSSTTRSTRRWWCAAASSTRSTTWSASGCS